MKTTRQTIELQQSGDDESKILATLWSPTTVGETIRVKVFVESHLDGSFDITRSAAGLFIVIYDGYQVVVTPVYSDSANAYIGTPPWGISLLSDDAGFPGGSGGVLIVGSGYGSGGPYTVNWKIDYEITDYNA
jgi:hypothetical protein